MKILLLNFAVAGLFAVVTACAPRNEAVAVHVAFKLMDNDGNPIADAPLRLVVGIPNWDADDWRGPDTGVRIITDKGGLAYFTAHGVVDRRWRWEPIGFTPFSIPVRVHHVGVGFEVARVLPSRHGDVTHHWFYTADIDRYADGSSSTIDVDRLYKAGPDKQFTRLLGKTVSSPESVIMIDGFALSGSGYSITDFALDPVGGGAKEWSLRLTLKQMPKPVLR